MGSPRPIEMKFKILELPKEGEVIKVENGALVVPKKVIIPYIEGDGVGPEVMSAAKRVLSAAVEKAYKGERGIAWFEIFAGEKAQKLYDELLPRETLEAIRHCTVALKGPLTTPIAGGHRSLNVALRQELDLYACVRPVYWLSGVPSPMKRPQDMNIVIFRENTEDVYAGIEWQRGSKKALKFISLMKQEFGVEIREDSGIGVKPMSEFGTKRLVMKAIRYALENNRRSVTLVHKGNIMKYTEGAFRDWGYEVAKREFGDKIVTEQEVQEVHKGKIPKGRLLLNDRLADNMFQQLLTRTSDYDVLAMPNLNGDYMSDAAAAQIGGLGMAPGANIGDYLAVFEATHGTAPKYAGLNKVNPCSLILSGAMMLEYIGWKEAAQLVLKGVKRTIKQKIVTYDLASQMKGAKEVRTSKFAEAVARSM